MFITVDEFRSYVSAPNLPQADAERIAGTADEMVCAVVNPSRLAGRVPASIKTATLMVAAAIYRQEQTGSGSWTVDDIAYPSPQAFTSGILRRYAPTYVNWVDVGVFVGGPTPSDAA